MDRIKPWPCPCGIVKQRRLTNLAPQNWWGLFYKILDDEHGEKVEVINLTLAKTIWKGHQPKKVKFFLWEIAHKAIAQVKIFPKKKKKKKKKKKRMTTYITLSPNWCSLCKKENESQSHLFMQCTYAHNF